MIPPIASLENPKSLLRRGRHLAYQGSSFPS